MSLRWSVLRTGSSRAIDCPPRMHANDVSLQFSFLLSHPVLSTHPSLSSKHASVRTPSACIGRIGGPSSSCSFFPLSPASCPGEEWGAAAKPRGNILQRPIVGLIGSAAFGGLRGWEEGRSEDKKNEVHCAVVHRPVGRGGRLVPIIIHPSRPDAWS